MEKLEIFTYLANGDEAKFFHDYQNYNILNNWRNLEKYFLRFKIS